MYDIQNNGVGIPDENPNLSDETIEIVNEVLNKIKNGEVVVSATGDGLI